MRDAVHCPKCGGVDQSTYTRSVNREGERVNNSTFALIVGGILYVITSVGVGAFVIFVVGTLLLTKLNGLGTIEGSTAVGLIGASLGGGILFSILLFLRGDQRWRAVATVYHYTCRSCRHHWEVFEGRMLTSPEASDANSRRR